MFSEYVQKEHFLTRIDVRIKLMFALLVLSLVLSSNDLFFPLCIAFCCFSLCFWMKVPLREVLFRFSEPMFIAAVLLLLKLLFFGEDVLFSFTILGFEVVGYKDGLLDGFRIASRIFGAVAILAVLGFSTPFTGFIAGLSWFRIPKQFVELLMLAYRYIFVLFEEAQVIYSAQKNRLGYSSIRHGLNSFSILSSELILRAFDHSQKTAMAMAQRGYTGEMPVALNTPLKASEGITAALIVAPIVVLWKIM